MKKLCVYLIALIINITIVCGQQYTSWINNWEKILISDSYGGWSHYNNEYQILSEDFNLKYLNQKDSILKQISCDIIDSIILSLKNNKELINDPLVMFNLDSAWLTNNAEDLWYQYNNYKKELPEISSIAINTLKNYSKIKPSLYYIQGSHWTDDYPFVAINIIKGADTLSITSAGQ